MTIHNHRHNTFTMNKTIDVTFWQLRLPTLQLLELQPLELQP